MMKSKLFTLDLLLDCLGLLLIGGDLVQQGFQRAGALACIDQIYKQIVEMSKISTNI